MIKDNKKLSFTNLMRYGEEKQKLYEAYLIDLTKSEKYYTNFLFDFLEISQLKRSWLITKK